MQQFTKYLTIMALISLILTMGCQKDQQEKDYNRELPPGAHALRKITDPAMYPDFGVAAHELADVSIAIDNSLAYLARPSSQQYFPCGDISHRRVIDSLHAFQELLNAGLYGSQLDQAVRQQFDVYMSIGCDDLGTVLFTGYYTPIFNGSWEKTDRFRYPLYNAPDDLVKNQHGEILGRRSPHGDLGPCPTRADIQSDPSWVAGREFIYLSDPFEVYIAHVQGSAYIRLPDQQIVTVGYAGNNGHDYRSLAQKMVADGIIAPENMNLQAMIQYFKAHPDDVQGYTAVNPRFVFFQEQVGPPRGSLNVPVTAMRSIATDKSVFPRGALAFVAAALPRQVGSHIIHPKNWGYALDQDTGGAIRAAGRCDVYMGKGDQAASIAGQLYQEGKLFYIFVKE